MRAGFVAVCGSVVFAAALAVPGWASLYEPDESLAVGVRPDGTGDPLPFDEFKRRLVFLTNLLNPTIKNPDGSPSDRDKLLARVQPRLQSRIATPDETAALVTDLIRLGQTDEAVNRVKPLYDDRNRRGTRTYFVCAALIHAHATRGEWDQALNYIPDLTDAEMPAQVKGLTPAQRNWQAKLDRDYLPHYLFIRKAESEVKDRSAQEDETPTPLFPLPEGNRPAAPVRFVNDAGTYEPGKLADAERAKLPSDAIAVTQQFVLWFPTDTRLYWLLAELCAANDQLDEAQRIFDECAGPRQYSSRKLMMDHRAAVTATVVERQKPPEPPISMRTVMIYFGVVAAFAAVAVGRALGRRGRRSFGPTG